MKSTLKQRQRHQQREEAKKDQVPLTLTTGYTSASTPSKLYRGRKSFTFNFIHLRRKNRLWILILFILFLATLLLVFKSLSFKLLHNNLRQNGDYYTTAIRFERGALAHSKDFRLVEATELKPKTQFLSEHMLAPDTNGLNLHQFTGSSPTANWRRQIHQRAEQKSEKERGRLLQKMDYRPDGVDRRFEDDSEYIHNHQCRRNNWSRKKLPNCNTAHEIFSLDRVGEYTIEYKGHGAFRNSWLFSRNHDDEEFVFKALRGRDSVYEDLTDIMYQIHKEAIIMERLTSSPRIVDIFGFCGTSIVAEHMSRLITGDIVTGSEDWEGYSGWMAQEELDKLQKDDVHPMNNLTNDEKLDLAIVMAESIADIHGFEGGVIAHGDIHPIQWLANSKGQIKLNDFNNAEILDFWPHDNEYCKIYRCYGGTYRSPEEFRCMDSHEAMDTYSMGNNIYILLVGLWPFYQYDPDDSRTVQRKLIEDTERPYVDPRYRNRSVIEAGLIPIMEQCWEWDLDKRLPIFDVVRQLYELRDRVRKQR